INREVRREPRNVIAVVLRNTFATITGHELSTHAASLSRRRTTVRGRRLTLGPVPLMQNTMAGSNPNPAMTNCVCQRNWNVLDVSRCGTLPTTSSSRSRRTRNRPPPPPPPHPAAPAAAAPAASAPPAAAAAAASASATAGVLLAEPRRAGVFLVEDKERSQTDVGDFFFAERNLRRNGIMGWRIRGRHRGRRGRTARQRQRREGGSDNRHGLLASLSLRSLRLGRHNRVLPYLRVDVRVVGPSQYSYAGRRHLARPIRDNGGTLRDPNTR